MFLGDRSLLMVGLGSRTSLLCATFLRLPGKVRCCYPNFFPSFTCFWNLTALPPFSLFSSLFSLKGQVFKILTHLISSWHVLLRGHRANIRGIWEKKISLWNHCVKVRKEKKIKLSLWSDLGFQMRWISGKESTCQHRTCRRHRFNPRVKKIPRRRKWQPPPVFLWLSW